MVAVVATGAIASIDHQMVRRELVDAIDNQLISRDEAEHLIDIWAREADQDPILATRDVVDGEIEEALLIRSDHDYLDDVYARDLDERDLQIRSDIEATFSDHEGLFTRALEQQEAILRVRELAARDPELFQLYRRGVKMTSLFGALGGAAIAGKGNRMKGLAIGGAAGFAGHHLARKLKSNFGGGSKKNGHGHHKRGGYSGDSGDDSVGDSEYRRRDIDDPELYER